MAVRKKNLRLSFILLSIVVCFFFGIMFKVMLLGHGETRPASVILSDSASALV